VQKIKGSDAIHLTGHDEEKPTKLLEPVEIGQKGVRWAVNKIVRRVQLGKIL
jgi:hypothetical protein